MQKFRPDIQLLRPIAAVLLLFSLQACTKWSLVPEPKTLGSNHGTVRLTLVGDAKHLIVKNPTVVGDSITWTSPERSSIQLSKVAWAETRSMDPIATGFFALVAVTAVSVILLRQ
jgi:hypothetical protein